MNLYYKICIIICNLITRLSPKNICLKYNSLNAIILKSSISTHSTAPEQLVKENQSFDRVRNCFLEMRKIYNLIFQEMLPRKLPSLFRLRNVMNQQEQ